MKIIMLLLHFPGARGQSSDGSMWVNFMLCIILFYYIPHQVPLWLVDLAVCILKNGPRDFVVCFPAEFKFQLLLLTSYVNLIFLSVL